MRILAALCFLFLIAFFMTRESPRDYSPSFVSAAAQHSIGSPYIELDNYERLMLPARRDAAIAYVAAVCQIRDDIFLTAFGARQQMILEQEVGRHALTPAEWKQATNDGNRAFGEILLALGTPPDGNLVGRPCQTLRANPSFLEGLDQKFITLMADPQIQAITSMPSGPSVGGSPF